MAAKPLPDQALLLKLLQYEPETGKLFWRERPASMYASESIMLRFNRHRAGKEAFTAVERGYRFGFMSQFGRLRAHRVIWCMVNGDWPEQIDHINQDRSDNRIENLRVASREQNARNCRISSRNRSGRIGVHWSSRIKRWRAKIRHGGRYIYLGDYLSFREACSARQAAEIAFGYSPLHGKKSRL